MAWHHFQRARLPGIHAKSRSSKFMQKTLNLVLKAFFRKTTQAAKIFHGYASELPCLFKEKENMSHHARSVDDMYSSFDHPRSLHGSKVCTRLFLG
jgi:hypothetical protein